MRAVDGRWRSCLAVTRVFYCIKLARLLFFGFLSRSLVYPFIEVLFLLILLEVVDIILLLKQWHQQGKANLSTCSLLASDTHAHVRFTYIYLLAA